MQRRPQNGPPVYGNSEVATTPRSDISVSMRLHSVAIEDAWVSAYVLRATFDAGSTFGVGGALKGSSPSAASSDMPRLFPGGLKRPLAPGSVYTCEQPHLFTSKKSRLQGTLFRSPHVALPGKRDRNRTWTEINAHDVPHFLVVQARIRLNEICQNFDDHIEDS